MAREHAEEQAKRDAAAKSTDCDLYGLPWKDYSFGVKAWSITASWETDPEVWIM